MEKENAKAESFKEELICEKMFDAKYFEALQDDKFFEFLKAGVCSNIRSLESVRSNFYVIGRPLSKANMGKVRASNYEALSCLQIGMTNMIKALEQLRDNLEEARLSSKKFELLAKEECQNRR